jgi:hypothetical protein
MARYHSGLWPAIPPARLPDYQRQGIVALAALPPDLDDPNDYTDDEMARYAGEPGGLRALRAAGPTRGASRRGRTHRLA